jgi:hypothetical protein
VRNVDRWTCLRVDPGNGFRINGALNVRALMPHNFYVPPRVLHLCRHLNFIIENSVGPFFHVPTDVTSLL